MPAGSDVRNEGYQFIESYVSCSDTRVSGCGTVALWHCGTRDSPDTPWLVVWMILDLGLFRLRLRFLYLECV